MKRYITIIVMSCVFTFFTGAGAAVYNIMDHGAVADGQTLNTQAIQSAIDECNHNGGGTVLVPTGTYITGTLHLKSNVNLHLESGAVLKGSANIDDYQPYVSSNNDSIHYGLMYTEYAENVSITGTGTIDGNEEAFFIWDQAKDIQWGTRKHTRQGENYRKIKNGIGDGPVVPKTRPYQMIIFSECKNVLIRDVLLTKSPFWTLHLADCDGVVVSGMKLWNSRLTPNSDGIDITSCTNVLISDCDIKAGDDAIAITGFAYHFELPGFSGRRHLSENINLINCNLQSSSSAIRIGALNQNDIRNVQISHVNITDSNRGLGIFLRDEGSLENISCTDMNIETRLHSGDWWGNGEPIHISAVRDKKDVVLGSLKNVTLRDITCTGETGILVYGTDESIIQDLRFDNIRFHLKNSPLNDVAGGNIDLRRCFIEPLQLFKHDIPAVFIQKVRGLTIRDFYVDWDSSITQPYFTHALQITDFENVDIANFQGVSSPANPKLVPVLLQNGTGVKSDLPEKNVKLEGVE